MSKTLSFGAMLAGAATLSLAFGFAANDAKALSDPAPDLSSPSPSGRGLANAPYVSSTGQTVPRPGLLPGGGQDEQERRFREKENILIWRGICSNC